MKPSVIRSKIGRASLLAAAFFSPAALVLATGFGAHWTKALPDILPAAKSDGDVSEMLGALSLSMSSIGIATVVGAAFLVRGLEERTARTWPIISLAAIFGSCVVAIFCGYRFQLAMAEQVLNARLNLDTIVDRLEWQATAVLVGASFLLPVALTGLFPPKGPNSRTDLTEARRRRIRNRARHSK